MRIIYNDGEIAKDIIGLLAYINNFTKELGVLDVLIDDRKCAEIINGMRQDFPHNDGIESASVFKKLANFIVYFVSERPIASPFPAELIGQNLAQIPNHQNAIIAFELALSNLHGATIESNGRAVQTIENPICISKHSYVDVIDALSNAAPQTHFHMTAVLLEQLAYKTNPDCQSTLYRS